MKLICVAFVEKGSTAEAVGLITRWPKNLVLSFHARIACVDSILEGAGNVEEALEFIAASSQGTVATHPAEQELYARVASRYLADGQAEKASALLKVDREQLSSIVVGQEAMAMRKRLVNHFLGQKQPDFENALRQALWGKDFRAVIIKMAKKRGTAPARIVLEKEGKWRRSIVHESAVAVRDNYWVRKPSYYSIIVFTHDELLRIKTLLDGMDHASSTLLGRR